MNLRKGFRYQLEYIKKITETHFWKNKFIVNCHQAPIDQTQMHRQKSMCLLPRCKCQSSFWLRKETKSLNTVILTVIICFKIGEKVYSLINVQVVIKVYLWIEWKSGTNKLFKELKAKLSSKFWKKLRALLVSGGPWSNEHELIRFVQGNATMIGSILWHWFQNFPRIWKNI